MTTELDKALNALRDERDAVNASIEVFEARANMLDAEIRGMERARDLFGPQVAALPSTRRSVQKPVMELFALPGQGIWTLDGIIDATGIPGIAVQKFLSYAVKNGMLRRLPTSAPGPNAEYGLPARVPEAAE